MNSRALRYTAYSIAGFTALALLVNEKLAIEPVAAPVELQEQRIAQWNEAIAKIPVVLDFPGNSKVVTYWCSTSSAAGTWRPTASQIRELEERLDQRIRSRLLAVPGKSLEDYVRQYVGSNRGGRRIICMNAAPIEFLRNVLKTCSEMLRTRRAANSECQPGWWRSLPITVDDGGSSFWRIVYDLETHEFSEFSPNGSA